MCILFFVLKRYIIKCGFKNVKYSEFVTPYPVTKIAIVISSCSRSGTPRRVPAALRNVGNYLPFSGYVTFQKT
jgi:hypothetical protein